MSNLKFHGAPHGLLLFAELVRNVITSYTTASNDRNTDRSVGVRILKAVQNLQTLIDQQEDLSNAPFVVQTISKFLVDLDSIREELDQASKKPATGVGDQACDINAIGTRLQRIDKDVASFYLRLTARGVVLAGLESYKMQSQMASLQSQVKDFVFSLKDDPKRAEELIGIRSMTEPLIKKALASTKQHLERGNVPRVENIFLTHKARLLEKALEKSKQAQSPTAQSTEKLAEDTPSAQRDALEGSTEGGEDPIIETIHLTRLLQEHCAAMPLEELADSLRRLGLALANLNWDLQALTITEWEIKAFQALANIGPLAYEKMLPVSLNRLSRCLQKLGDKCGALQAMEEAVAICRKLAKSSQASHRLDLGMSLLNLSVHLEDVGRAEHAFKHIDEAHTLYQMLLDIQSRVSRRTLASDLRYLSARLRDVGRKEDAVKTAIEFAKLYWALACDDPDTFMQNYGQSLVELSGYFEDAGRQDDALVAIHQAIEVYRRLAEAQPSVFLSHLATALTSASVYFTHASRKEPAVKAAAEAVSILRTLAEGSSSVRPALAQSLNNLSNCLTNAGRKDEALATLQEAAKIRRKLSRQHTADRVSSPDTPRQTGLTSAREVQGETPKTWK